MRYASEDAIRRHHIDLNAVGSIHRTGSVIGMRQLYRWPKGGQLRVGAYIYNIGPELIERLRNAGDLRG